MFDLTGSEIKIYAEADPTNPPTQIIAEDSSENDSAGPAPSHSDDNFSLPEEGLSHHFDGLRVQGSQQARGLQAHACLLESLIDLASQAALCR